MTTMYTNRVKTETVAPLAGPLSRQPLDRHRCNPRSHLESLHKTIHRAPTTTITTAPATESSDRTTMEQYPDCSSLICDEDISHLDDHPLKHSTDLGENVTDDDDGYIETLVSRECSFESRRSDEKSSKVADWLSRARSNSVNWILIMKSFFGFGAQTAYLAVAYFDRFLARKTIDEERSWALKLLSISCLSLAAKMEEIRPPALPEFQMEGCSFDNAAMQRMELLVLNTLEWRMSPVTPFAYLGHFASRIESNGGSEDLVSRAIGFIFTITKVMNIVDCRPSVIAAAAIMAASGQVLTKKQVESKISTIPLPESLEADHVFACYNVMIQESLKAMKVLISSDQLENCASIDISSVDVIEQTSFTGSSLKRRRLL